MDHKLRRRDDELKIQSECSLFRIFSVSNGHHSRFAISHVLVVILHELALSRTILDCA